ncbi:hypothetical protein ACFXA9_14555, partial [Streptomyces sp. NPDC059411]
GTGGPGRARPPPPGGGGPQRGPPPRGRPPRATLLRRASSAPPSAPAPRALAAVSALCVALFALITWQVLVSGPLLTLDARLSRALVRTVPDEVTQRLSDLGNVPVAVPVLVFAVVYAAPRGPPPAGGGRAAARAPGG